MSNLKSYEYHLPKKLIAQRPASKRDASRLLNIHRDDKSVTHLKFRDFPSLLNSNDLLVINDSAVFPARLKARRSTGATIEILLVRNLGKGAWTALIKGIRRLHVGERLRVGESHLTLMQKHDTGSAEICFESSGDSKDTVAQYGMIPLPPYISRPNDETDKEDSVRYQTVFATQPGSCAAPTAGLHFTKEIIHSIKTRGVKIVNITLHVGPGTFRPIKSDNIDDHIIDNELYSVSTSAAQAINKTKSEGGRIVAVGTTAVRTLESTAVNGLVEPGNGETNLLIKPGHKFEVVDALLTNFHLPKSTLLMLVAAFSGREFIVNIYNQAIKKGYRFYSYGDCMFIQ
ncbi:MAG TPA: tRNA preQ1(34) S-adenosylmethionine ribosyltransferase-isomerase QueA [Nitrospinota bacterium]|nr:tRNA preQ1(34) S-adenosylmethionine ribosyltransferase-isomerase QueA [Nitrospinota bacterium]|tara:strand:+ start:101125 stop:102156 length:1032 start_codon:yes stop_codon:yes gene_type:complete